MSESQRRRYKFNFNLQDANEFLAKNESMVEYGFGEVDPQITVSVTAANERRAMILVLALIKTLKVERWIEQFEKAMNSGDYETAIG